MSAETLLDPVTAHCFFAGGCDHVEVGFEPDAVHAAMETHYEGAHRGQLDALTGKSQDTPRRRVGDVLDLEIGTSARRKYEVVSVQDDDHFTVRPIAQGRRAR